MGTGATIHKRINPVKEVAKWTLLLLGTACLLTIAIFCIIYLPWLAIPNGSTQATANPSEFISIILTAISVILTALTIILAIAGAVGYVTIREAAKESSRVTAATVSSEVARDIMMAEMEEIKSIASRAAEQVARQVSGQGQNTGDDISLASGGDNTEGSSGEA